MYIKGWAFEPNEKEMQQQYYDRYMKIKDTPGVVITDTPCYKHGKFSGTLETEEAQMLTELDIALIADHGSLCFGGSCSKNGNSFSGTYDTD